MIFATGQSLLSVPSSLGLLPPLPPGAIGKYLLFLSAPAGAALPSCTFFWGCCLTDGYDMTRRNLGSAANRSRVERTRRVSCIRPTTKASEGRHDLLPYGQEDGPQVFRTNGSEKLKVICWRVVLASNWGESIRQKPFALSLESRRRCLNGMKERCRENLGAQCRPRVCRFVQV